MERRCAEVVSRHLTAVDVVLASPINVLEEYEKAHPDEQARAMRKAAFKVIGNLYFDISAPIAREYPDLTPDMGEPPQDAT